MITNNQVMTYKEFPIHGLDGCKHFMLESGRNVIKKKILIPYISFFI